jgi:hypothetical protein
MIGKLSTRSHELGLGRTRLQMNGRKVRSLQLEQSLRFEEVLNLLPPSTSLARFREMCGLREERKFLFPFEKLDESLAFLQERSLPRSASEWTSRLRGGRGPSQEEVDEVIAFYEQMNFESVKSFLIFYLKQDCLMLGKGFERLNDIFFRLFRLDVIDSRSFSISGIAAKASQMHLFKTKSVGMFSTQDTRLFALQQAGHRGGITAGNVSRCCCW